MSHGIKTPAQIDAMRRGGKILAQVLYKLHKETAAGKTPKDMSLIAAKELKRLGGKPAFLGFEGYPDIICISVNDQVQHAIPTDKPFKKGDLVNYDFGVSFGGMVTDGGISICVGNQPNNDQKRLLIGTEIALAKGIAAVKDGCHVGDISAAIEDVLRQHRLGIVRELVGHGVGYKLHEEPEIPNYGVKGTGPILRSGMTIAIEPIANLGREEIVGDKDGWTLWTNDGSLSAQFEHTVVVTDYGCEILTEL